VRWTWLEQPLLANKRHLQPNNDTTTWHFAMPVMEAVHRIKSLASLPLLGSFGWPRFLPV